MVRTLNIYARSLAFVCLTICATIGVHSVAQSTEQMIGGVKLSGAWIRASVPGQINGAGYLQIMNDNVSADRLIAVSVRGVNRTELHTVLTENGVAKMRELSGIELPARGTVTLAPGGMHLMFLGLSEPFKTGAIVPVTITFEKAGTVVMNFEIKPPTYNPGTTAGHGTHRH